MQNDILDYFKEENSFYDKKIIQIKTFYFATEAEIMAARLKDEGIPCFVSNANVVTAMPLGNGTVGLHVREDHEARARQLIEEMEENLRRENNEDFHDADHDDIEFQKRLNEQANQGANISYKIAMGILIVFIVIVLLKNMYDALN